MQHSHQAVGGEVAVAGVVHGAGDLHADPGLERGGTPGIEHFGSDAETARLLGDPPFLFEAVVRPAKHEEPSLLQAEILLAGGKLLVAGLAREAQIAQERCGAFHVRGARRAPELERPVHQLPGGARPHVERRRRVPHPFQAQGHHAGRGERHEMARHQHAGVLERAAVAPLGIALDDGDAPAAPRAVERGAQADHPAARDEDVLSRAQRIPQANGSRSSMRSVLSALT